MKAFRRTVACFLTGLASTAHACTVCDSQNGHALRAGLFNGHFLHTLLIVAAPVPILVGLVTVLHFGMPDLQVADEQRQNLGPLGAEPVP